MLPPTLSALELLAYNLWWSWDTEATELWQRIDPWRWDRCRHNPAALLQDVQPSRVEELSQDADFLAHLDRVLTRFQTYQRASTWCSKEVPALTGKSIAYFSMEFGIHESLRIYSGGLGVLAGDHVRSASDLGVPLIGVGLLYRRGYFRQVIDDGLQIPAYPTADFDRLPIRRCVGDRGRPITIAVPIHNRICQAHIYQLDVGRTRILLLDTDHPDNDPRDRALTQNLYGGDTITRVSQEVLLGIGGVRALRATGEVPDLFHLNEGHCAFVALELIREQRKRGHSSADALNWVRDRCCFTTHTPVPAGHDRFSWGEVDHVLGPWRHAQDLKPGAFMDLGRERPGDQDEPLCMTVLALRASSKANGVSKLHGAVSRDMWHSMWPSGTVDEVPIGHVTNGVHPLFWMSHEARAVYDEYLPGWRDRVWDPAIWAGVADIPDDVMWKLRNTLRAKLCNMVRERSGTDLDPNALTIGFARRFAPYKRGDLIFSDPERLEAIMESGPVNLIYAGKAHPRDGGGQDIVATVLRWSADRRFRDRVAFIEDYDMTIGRALTAGADVWLNNPRRPKEASGTSGQKVPLNGGINLSVLDGWWPEAYDGTNGWAIGRRDAHASVEAHDAFDAASLYEVLEDEVLPIWKDRAKNGIPAAWVERSRRSILTCAPLFTSHRMLRDYVNQMYSPLLGG